MDLVIEPQEAAVLMVGDKTGAHGAWEPIRLERMPQQAKARVASEDWTGITSQAERRRLQNRINQRARRKRLGAKSSKTPSYTCTPPPPTATAHPPSSLQIVQIVQAARRQNDKGEESRSDGSTTLTELVPGTVREICQLGSREWKDLAVRLDRWANDNMARLYLPVGSSAPNPQADNLISLVKFNCFRAMMQNFILLQVDIDEALDDGCISSFSTPYPSPPSSSSSPTPSPTPGPRRPRRPSPSESGTTEGDAEEEEEQYAHLPPPMRPTALQRRIPHHPWIDAIPVARMRDNILSAGARFEAVEDEFCTDVADFSGLGGSAATATSYDGGGGGRDGIVVWGESWDPKGWELTEAFVLRWGWVLRGCVELFESTNYWRAMRGEKPFPFETR